MEQADRGVVAVYGRPHVNRTRSAQGSESEKSSRSEDDKCGSFALSNEAMAGRSLRQAGKSLFLADPVVCMWATRKVLHVAINKTIPAGSLITPMERAPRQETSASNVSLVIGSSSSCLPRPGNLSRGMYSWLAWARNRSPAQPH
ncbi:unnamed protein product [Clonostachys byssicola]|uniref:Uncharacterized protein n=1 Tax=Clonostachys byssicola TaxID=160290 RepID=A0A9N9US84_9HYPO|nr:unnamed protein product [Clonostachys byssicola]